MIGIVHSMPSFLDGLLFCWYCMMGIGFQRSRESQAGEYRLSVYVAHLLDVALVNP
jgi:hypothetical protein